jgi:flavin-dependent dehydrogenase
LAVVGAGFAGLIASRELSNVADVTLFEEHGEVGVPEHCTGIVSEKVVKMIGKSAEVSVEGYLNEFKMGVPSGEGLILKGPKKFTAKLDRVKLERELLREVLSLGAGLRNELVIKVAREGRVNEEQFDRVIIAEGWRAELSSKLGIAHKARKVYGINLEVKGRTAYPGMVEIWFDKSLAPGFFAWVIMLEEKAIVGTASEPGKANVRELAKEVLNRAKKRGLVEGSVVKEYGGVILTGPPTLTPCVSKTCSFGDSAGLNKPLTGGGLYPNVVIAKRFPSTFPSLVKAYHPLVGRLFVETAIARVIHKAPQRTYQKIFTELNGMEIKVTEYDYHVKVQKERGEGKEV